jgi:hypothetical protein
MLISDAILITFKIGWSSSVEIVCDAIFMAYKEFLQNLPSLKALVKKLARDVHCVCIYRV